MSRPDVAGDKAVVRVLRKAHTNLTTIIQTLMRQGWSPGRCAVALELPEAYLIRTVQGIDGRVRQPPKRRIHRLEEARKAISTMTFMQLAALRQLIVDSRLGRKPIDQPTGRGSSGTVAALIDRQLVTRHGESQWLPTPLGLDVDLLATKRRRHATRSLDAKS